MLNHQPVPEPKHNSGWCFLQGKAILSREETAMEQKTGKRKGKKPEVRALRKAGHQQKWRETLIN